MSEMKKKERKKKWASKFKQVLFLVVRETVYDDKKII